MKIRKRHNHYSTGKYFLWILVFLAFTMSCQEDEMLRDSVAETEYKGLLALLGSGFRLVHQP